MKKVLKQVKDVIDQKEEHIRKHFHHADIQHLKKPSTLCKSPENVLMT